MAALSALIASHAGIEPATPTPTGSGSSNGHPDPATANFGSVHFPLGLIRVLAVSENDKGKTRYTTGHPDLL